MLNTIKQRIKRDRYKQILRIARSAHATARNGQHWFDSFKPLEDLARNCDWVPKGAASLLSAYKLKGKDEQRRFFYQVFLTHFLAPLGEALLVNQARTDKRPTDKQQPTPKLDAATLPPAWHRFLHASGQKLPFGLLGFTLYGLRALKAAYGAYHSRRALLKNQGSQFSTKPVASIQSAPLGLVPTSEADLSHKQITWLSKTYGWALDAPWHVVTNGDKPASLNKPLIQLSPNPLPALQPEDLQNFKRQSAWLLVKQFSMILMGQWWRAFLLNELLQACFFQNLHDEAIAKTYVFSNTQYGLRPLWTYLAAERGSAIWMLMYSSNVRAFQNQQANDTPSLPNYYVMSWPHYICMGKGLAAWLKKHNSTASVELQGTIHFTDSQASVPELPENAIILFDVPPRTLTANAIKGLPPTYYLDAIVSQFLIQATQACEEQGLQPVLKTKKAVSLYKNVTPGYRRTLQDLVNNKRLLLVDDTITAGRYAPHVRAAVSIPFTSTAIIFDHYQVPSIYFDPTGQLQSPQDVGGDELSSATGTTDIYSAYSNGIAIASSKAALSQWLTALPPT